MELVAEQDVPVGASAAWPITLHHQSVAELSAKPFKLKLRLQSGQGDDMSLLCSRKPLLSSRLHLS